MFKRIALAAVVVALTGCSQPQVTEQSFNPSSLIQGELTAQSYLTSAQQLVTQASQLMVNKELTLTQLQLHITKVNALLKMMDELEQDPAQLYGAELLSTLGSLYAKQAVFYSNNAKLAGSSAAKGFRYLDKAVSRYPNNMTARLNRGLVSAMVPEFMNKTSVARADLEFVVNNAQFSELHANTQQSVRTMLAKMNARVQG